VPSKAGDDLRKSYSQSDEQMARQFTERGQFAESVAYLTRSLRTDPQNSLSSTNLLSLLSNVHLMHPSRTSCRCQKVRRRHA
jgi:hypothetical protein